MSDIESEIRLFADDCVCYREIKDMEDILKLQKDIGHLGIWARKWGMRFQPVKCNIMRLTKKHNKIQASYTLEVDLGMTVDPPPRVNFGHYDFLILQCLSHKMRHVGPLRSVA